MIKKVTNFLLMQHGKDCPYCNKTMIVPLIGKSRNNTDRFPTREHVIPRSLVPGMGFIVACNKCNRDKNNKMIDEWADHLDRQSDPRGPIVRAWMKANLHFKRIALNDKPDPEGSSRHADAGDQE